MAVLPIFYLVFMTPPGPITTSDQLYRLPHIPGKDLANMETMKVPAAPLNLDEPIYGSGQSTLDTGFTGFTKPTFSAPAGLPSSYYINGEYLTSPFPMFEYPVAGFIEPNGDTSVPWNHEYSSQTPEIKKEISLMDDEEVSGTNLDKDKDMNREDSENSEEGEDNDKEREDGDKDMDMIEDTDSDVDIGEDEANHGFPPLDDVQWKSGVAGRFIEESTDDEEGTDGEKKGSEEGKGTLSASPLKEYCKNNSDPILCRKSSQVKPDKQDKEMQL